VSGFLLDEYPAGATIAALFHTFSSAGASITLTGLAVTDVEIYKNGSATQRASDAGYALLDTDGIDFDGITGIHGLSIDTADNTDAGFYTVGAQFTVVVSAVTVDGQTVSLVLGSFRLMAAEATAGQPAVTVNAIANDAITASAIATGAVDAEALATDAVNEIVDAVWDEVLTAATHNVASSAGRRLRHIASLAMVDAAVSDAGATTTSFVTSLTSAVDDFYNDQLLIFTSGTLNGQAKPILDYNGTTKAVTVSEAFTSAPGNGDTFTIQATHIHPVEQVGAGVWDLTTSGHVTAGTFGAQLKTLLDTVAGYLDTEVAAIKAKTDQLTFTEAGEVDANLQSINDQPLTGDGSSGNKWRP
jgi:sorbitol-specific phosphotransferase system component IIA